MFKEFKEFILTGNVIDFAVAVILAGAVGKVVNGFVNDIVMPIVGSATGGAGVEGAADFVAENAIRYGAWINTIINLMIVGFVMFLIVKAYNKASKKKEEVAGPTSEELLTEIRDALKK
ncbi:UNVERIFIED_CONTAM: hypothetical protein GTU68_039516 [Idotea baltica]|nr:hypothetical protein [Idotea baltica]